MRINLNPRDDIRTKYMKILQARLVLYTTRVIWDKPSTFSLVRAEPNEM